MRPVFDFDQLNALLRDFYELTQIRITVFDDRFRELTFVPGTHAPLCTLIRAAGGEAACRDCDRAACARASRQSSALIYRCHAGLMEAIMPFYVKDTLVGYLILGQALVYPSRDAARAAVEPRCRALGVDSGRLRAAFDASPLVSESCFQSATHILHALASYLTLEKMATLKEERVAERLDNYICEHFTEPMTAQTLCDRLQIGKTQLYSLSKQLYGSGVAQQVRKLRIEKARRLLAERPDMSVGDVAEACGFSDYNYFISVFTRMTQESPSRYRRHAAGRAAPETPAAELKVSPRRV